MKPEFHLWGLDEHFAQFEAVLSRRMPGLVLVTGRPNSGKSSFLREAGALAAKHGWNAVRGDRLADLEVKPSTTAGTFTSQVFGLLEVSEAIPAAPGGSGSAPSVPPQSEALAVHLKNLATSVSPGVLLVVDGYRPEPGFDSWFKSLLEDLKTSGAPVIVAVADDRVGPDSLVNLASTVIPLNSRNADDVRRRWEEIGRRLNPPMESPELDRYVDEALKKPQIIGPLQRVLALALQGS